MLLAQRCRCCYLNGKQGGKQRIHAARFDLEMKEWAAKKMQFWLSPARSYRYDLPHPGTLLASTASPLFWYLLSLQS